MLKLIAVGIFYLQAFSLLAENVPAGPWPTKGAVFDDSSRLLLPVGVLGLAVIGCFAYFYWRDWSLERQFRQMALMAQGGATLEAPVASRKSLISTPRSIQKCKGGSQRGPSTGGSPPAPASLRPEKQGSESKTSSAAAPRDGIVTVRAGDDHEEIFIDGAFVGMAPARLRLSEGTRTVELRQNGQALYSRQITVLAGGEASLNVALHPDVVRAS